MKKPTAIYQVGVDVLGFPIYIEHHIFDFQEKKPTQNGNLYSPKQNKRNRFFVLEKQVKQH